MTADQRRNVTGKTEQKVEDAEFLVENFDLPTPRAADLVSGEDERTGEIEEEARRREKRDPLADVPVPQEPGEEMVEDSDEVRLKPVVRRNGRHTPSGR